MFRENVSRAKARLQSRNSCNIVNICVLDERRQKSDNIRQADKGNTSLRTMTRQVVMQMMVVLATVNGLILLSSSENTVDDTLVGRWHICSEKKNARVYPFPRREPSSKTGQKANIKRSRQKSVDCAIWKRGRIRRSGISRCRQMADERWPKNYGQRVLANK